MFLARLQGNFHVLIKKNGSYNFEMFLPNVMVPCILRLEPFWADFWLFKNRPKISPKSTQNGSNRKTKGTIQFGRKIVSKMSHFQSWNYHILPNIVKNPVPETPLGPGGTKKSGTNP